MTFSELDGAAANITGGFQDDLGRNVNTLIAHAADNAADDAGRMESLKCLLAHQHEARTPDVLRWFAERGVAP